MKYLIGRHLTSILPELGIYAGGIAFFFLLSLAPFLVVTLGLASAFLPFDIHEPVIAILRDLIPQQGILKTRDIVYVASEAGGRGLLTATFLFAFWSTSSFMTSLTHALQLIFSTQEERRKGWLMRLYSLVMVVIWGGFIAVTSWLFLLAPVIEGKMAEMLHWAEAEAFLIQATRLIVLIFMFIMAFSLTYRLNARKAMSTRHCFEGGAIATTGWMLVGWAFTYVLPTIWKKSVVFGALGSVVATLLWVYATAWVALIGAAWVRMRSTKE
ncbi:MAG: YihY/virulence factor BrkB family protein [Verrucomicrobiota bacterium]